MKKHLEKLMFAETLAGFQAFKCLLCQKPFLTVCNKRVKMVTNGKIL